MAELAEIALLREAQNGDMDAYTDLQVMLEPAIRRFAGSMIDDPDVVEDVVQDTFIAFYQNMQRVEPVENLRPYIFRIARNRCYDELRRWQRRETVSLDDEPVQVRVSYTAAADEAAPDDLTHWLLLHLEVQDAIAQLPDVQRQSLLLYTEENMSYAEIAEIMDVSIGTVKSRIHHAKRGLRGLLRPETLQALEMEFSA